MRIAFVPIDNRPVCYTLPKLISELDDDLELLLPDRNYLGDLTKCAEVEAIRNWLKSIQNTDAIVLSLDTLIYGGLIPSRRIDKTFEELKSELDELKQVLKEKECRIYAFSSIMRISNNNYNEEEKEYWAQYGEKIFKYSYDLNKNGTAQTDVPEDIIKDYLSTRKRNFDINKELLKWQKEGLFELLIFSKDDCAQFGLNVAEAKELEQLGGFTKTGADEIPLSLLSRAIEEEFSVCVNFTEPDEKDRTSNYEDVSIEKSVLGQLELANAKITDEANADIILYVNNFIDKQGEHVMKWATKHFEGNFVAPNKPYMVADVRYANGSDNAFVEELLKNDLTKDNFYGYSAWNTSANTLGSLICAAKVKLFAKKYNLQAFKKLQMTRFLDDWAYQANVRQDLNNTDLQKLEEKLIIYKQRIDKFFSTSERIKYSFPWNRLFEVEIEFN